jgi:hypothetical protein
MKKMLLAIGLVTAMAGSVYGASLDADIYLTKDKTMLGAGVSFVDGLVGFDLDLAFVYINEDAERAGFPTDDSFIGNLLGIHLVFRPVKRRQMEGRVGVGFDYWALWGINGDEYKMGLPIFVEGRYFVDRTLNVHLQVRSYLLASEGLGLGVDFDGDETQPVLLTVGIGGTWE